MDFICKFIEKRQKTTIKLANAQDECYLWKYEKFVKKGKNNTDILILCKLYDIIIELR